MSNFSLDDAAVAEIRRILGRSKRREPVAKLYEEADPGHLFDEIKADLVGGTKTPEELAAASETRLMEVQGHLEFVLMVAAWERSIFRLEDLCEMGGITFAMDPEIAEMLRGYRLTFEQGRFFLKGADNVAHTLRSLFG
jgi:hypothetical protein